MPKLNSDFTPERQGEKYYSTSKLSNAGQMKLYQKQQNYKNQPINLSMYYGPVAGSVTKNTLMANGNSSGGHSRNSKRVNTL